MTEDELTKWVREFGMVNDWQDLPELDELAMAAYCFHSNRDLHGKLEITAIMPNEAKAETFNRNFKECVRSMSLVHRFIDVTPLTKDCDPTQWMEVSKFDMCVKYDGRTPISTNMPITPRSWCIYRIGDDKTVVRYRY